MPELVRWTISLSIRLLCNNAAAAAVGTAKPMLGMCDYGRVMYCLAGVVWVWSA